MELPTFFQAVGAVARAVAVLILVVFNQPWAPYAAGAVVFYALGSRQKWTLSALIGAVLMAGAAGLAVVFVTLVFVEGGGL